MTIYFNNFLSFKVSPNQFKRDSSIYDQIERWIADEWEIYDERPIVEVLDGYVEVHDSLRTYTYDLPSRFLKIKKIIKPVYLTLYARKD